MKILITGGSGFVGTHITRFFAKKSSVVATYFNSQIADDLVDLVDGVRLDVRDDLAVEAMFRQQRPDVVIHVAGNKHVRDCEQHPEVAYQLNSLGTQNVARACRQLDARLVYLSSDLVFGGQPGGYRETDLPESNLVYGKTKLWGEKLARQELETVAICRSGGIYGGESPLLAWFSTQLAVGEHVECFTDVFNTPTYVENLAETIEVILQRELWGIFHTVGRERVSRYQFFRAYAEVFGLDTAKILPIAAGQDRRSRMLLQADVSLSSEISSRSIGVRFDSVAEGFQRMVDACKV